MKKSHHHTFIKDIPSSVSEVIIINNSTDNTIQVAKNAGATVLSENRKAMAMLAERLGIHQRS
jgi:hypothetical protein